MEDILDMTEEEEMIITQREHLRKSKKEKKNRVGLRFDKQGFLVERK